MQSLFINWIIGTAIFAAVATYTPLIQWGFKFGVFDYILETVRGYGFLKGRQGNGLLEDYSNKLTGSRSHLIYGPKLLNPNDKVEDWRWEEREILKNRQRRLKLRKVPKSAPFELYSLDHLKSLVLYF